VNEAPQHQADWALARMVFSQKLSFLLLLASAVVVPLYYDHALADGYTLSKQAAIELFSIALFVVFVYGLTGQKAARICFTALGAPVAALLGWAVVSLFFSTNVYAAFDRLFVVLALAVLFLVGPNLIRTRRALQSLVVVILTVAFAVSFLGTLQYFHKTAPVAALNTLLGHIGLGPVEPGLDTYNRETYCSAFGHANFAGQYLVTVIPLALSLAVWGLAMRKKTLALAVIACLAAFALVVYLGITFCRGAWVGTLAAIAVMLFFSPQRRRFVIGALVAIALLSALSPFIKDDEGKSMAQKFATMFDLKDRPIRFRFLVWGSSLRIIKDNPQGAGLGNFRVIYAKYRTVQERQNTGWDKIIFKAHNDYVQTFVELGVPGFAAFLWLIFVLFKMAGSLARKRADAFLRAVWLGLLGGIVGTLVHSFFSSNLQLPGSSYSFWLTLGAFAGVYGIVMRTHRPCLETKIVEMFASRPAQESGSSASVDRARRIIRALLILILGLGSTIPFRALLGNYHLEKAQYYEDFAHASKNSQEWRDRINHSLDHIRKAVWLCPRNYDIRYFSAIVENLAGNYDVAQVDNEMAVKLAPYFDYIINHLGTVLYNQAKFSEALARFRRALELNPMYLNAHINLGNVYRQLADYDAALKQYDEALKIDPRNAAPLLSKAIVYQQIAEDIYRMRGLTKTARSWLSKAQKLYEKVLKITPKNIKILNNLGTLHYTLGDVTGARSYFEKAISILPEHISARINLARLCEEQGDIDCAITNYEALVSITQGRNPEFARSLERLKAKRAKLRPGRATSPAQ